MFSLACEITEEGIYYAEYLIHFLRKQFRKQLLVSIVYYAVHFFALYSWFQLPEEASRCYVSEKNLQCGVEPLFNETNGQYAFEIAQELRSKFPTRNGTMQEALYIYEHLLNYGIEVELHKYEIDQETGLNVVAMIKAPRTQGTECIVVSSRYDTSPYKDDSSGSIGFLISLAQYMHDTNWQARDVLIVFTSEENQVSGIEAWLRDYHTPSVSMLRGGKIYASIGIESVGNSDMNRIIVMPEGLNGFLPNLDLVNVLTTTSYLQNYVAGADVYSSYEPLREVWGTALFYLHMGMSLPRSNHAAFTRYGLNSVGVTTDFHNDFWDSLKSPLHLPHKKELFYPPLSNSSFVAIGRIVEVVIHNLHNADEQLHQSFRWYSLTSATDFLDTGEALKPFIIIIVSFAIQLLAQLESYDGNLARSCLATLPHFLNLVISCALFLLYPFVLSFVLFGKTEKANFIFSQPLELSTTLGTAVGLIVVIVFLNRLIFAPTANSVVRYFLGEGALKEISWRSWKVWTILYYFLWTFSFILSNIQFGFLATILTLPIFDFKPTRLSARHKGNYFSTLLNAVELLLWTFLTILSHPITLMFFAIGYWKLGLNWIVGMLIASYRYGSAFWPFGIACFLPTTIVVLSVIYKRKEE